jgi:methionyl-tRNA formyltransferase
MGTPEFAVASLDALIQSGCNIVAVVTAPDKQAGRGMQIQQSAVKKYAIEKSLTVLQPIKLKDPSFINELNSLKPDLQIVVAFRMLPEIVWSLPPMGTINLHGSLLPQYRGAAPINWALINGEKETGVTTFKLQHEIDTGNILLQEKIAITENETAGTLHDKMKIVGANLLVDTIKGVATNSIVAKPQSETTELKHAPKLTTENSKINWDTTPTTIVHLIHGLSPFPSAHTTLHGKFCKVFSAISEETNHTLLPGEILSDGKTYLKIACKKGFVSLLELQLEGKKRMNIEDFLRGYRFPSNT